MNKQIQITNKDKNPSINKQIQTNNKESNISNNNKQIQAKNKNHYPKAEIAYKIPVDYKMVSSRYKQIKSKKDQRQLFEQLHPSIICHIFKFLISSIDCLYSFCLLNKKLYCSLLSNPSILLQLNLLNHSIQNLTIDQLQQQYLLNRVIKQSNFVYQVTQLFQYGAQKMNLANKLYSNLQIQYDFTINNKPVLKTQQKTLGTNFQQNILIKIDQINKQDMTLYDEFIIKVNSLCPSLNLKQSSIHPFSYKNIQTKCIKLKAFNYYIDSNFLFVFFNNDPNKILYFIFQINVQQLIQSLMNISRQYLSKMLNYKILKTVPKDLKVNKIKNNRLSYTSREEFQEYIRNCMDFELFFKIHNNDKVLFDYANTKIFPIEIDNTTALFLTDINQQMDHYNNVQLNDQIGMQEKIEGLALLDLVLKNHDDYLINQSSFITIQQQELQQSFDVTQSFLIKITHSAFQFSLQIHKEYNAKQFIVRELQIQLKNIYSQ